MPAGTNLEAIWEQNRYQDHFRCRTTLDDAQTCKSPSQSIDFFKSKKHIELKFICYVSNTKALVT